VLQHNLQQEWTYEFCPNSSPQSRPGAKQPTAAAPQLVTTAPRQARDRLCPRFSSRLIKLMAVVPTASLLLLAVSYISAQAVVAKVHYQSRQLAQETAALRAQNLNLRCQLSQALDLARIEQLAKSAGMQPADPAKESDFLPFPASQIDQAVAKSHPKSLFSQGPALIAALSHQLSPSWAVGRAEASTTEEGKRQKGQRL